MSRQQSIFKTGRVSRMQLYRRYKKAAQDDLLEIQRNLKSVQFASSKQQIDYCSSSLFTSDSNVSVPGKESSDSDLLKGNENSFSNFTSLHPNELCSQEFDQSQVECVSNCSNTENHESVNYSMSDDSTPNTEYSSTESTSDDLLNHLIRNWALQFNVRHTELNALLAILQPYHTYLPRDARTLLNTPREKCPVEVMDSGEFLYIGVEKNIIWLLEKQTKINPDISTLNLSVNFDGQSPYGSSRSQIWPILGLIPELGQSVFLIAAYLGNKKPAAKPYLKKFVGELKELDATGVKYKEREFKLSFKSVVCDAPACALIKGTKSHGGFYGCGKCFVKGEKINGCMVFLERNAQLRNNRNFRDKVQPEHHLLDSPISKLKKIDMVESFPLDYMHLVLLGVVKRLLNAWKEGISDGRHKRRKGKLSEAAVGAVDGAILQLHRFCPAEFSRSCRPISQSVLWKATESRQFLLYIGPIVMKGFVNSDMYRHFLLLHIAIRVFCSDKLVSSFGRLAHTFLVQFVEEAANLYGESFIVYNVHNLVHLYACVKRDGCLDNFSAFPYENFQRSIRNLLRGTLKPLQQIWKRSTELQSNEKKLKRDTAEHNPVGSITHTSGPTCGLNGTQFKRVKYLGLVLKCSDDKNSYICLHDGTIIKVLNFILKGSEMFVVGNSFVTYRDLYDSPIPSSKIGIHVVSGLSNTTFVWRLSKMRSKIFLIPFQNEPKAAAVELLHSSH